MLYLFCFLAEMWQGLSNVCTNSILNGSLVRMANCDKLCSIMWLLATRDWAKLDLLLEVRASALVSQTVFQILKSCKWAYFFAIFYRLSLFTHTYICTYIIVCSKNNKNNAHKDVINFNVSLDGLKIDVY